jgi:hypothetical protein
MLLIEIFQQNSPLFVSRPLVNVSDIAQWAATQGFTSTLADDMHVTIAFSKQPLNWGQFTPQKNNLIVHDTYGLKRLGDKGAIVLSFLPAASDAHLRRWTSRSCDD